ncbi:MAG: phage tail protein [Alphaproteobacteria bacterium]|nr:phage tail protein [Alphaproteobacteria bacterium]
MLTNRGRKLQTGGKHNLLIFFPSRLSLLAYPFFNDATHRERRKLHYGNSVKNFDLTFGNGDKLEGAFQITSYQRAGSYSDVETYSLTLSSAGQVTFTTA